MNTETAHSRRWWALIAVAFATFVTTLDNTVVNVALPSIQRDLGLSMAGVEWIISGYLVAFASFMLVGGRLSDAYGRRRLFLSGLAVFVVTSLLAGFSPNEQILVVARISQGIGAALVTPACLAIVGIIFEDTKERTVAVAVWTGVAALALALGPVVGGVLSQYVHWSWIFFSNVPIGLATMALAGWAISESHDPDTARHIDVGGLVTSAIALGGLTFVLIQGNVTGWTSAPILAVLALALIAAAAFVFVESKVTAPMLDTSIFGNRVFTGGTLTVLMWGAGVMGVFAYTSIFLQNVLHFSPSVTGLVFLPLAFAMFAGAPLAAMLASRLGANKTVALALTIMAVGLVDFAFLGTDATFVQLVPGLVLIGVGSGLITPLTSDILGALPKAREGVGSAVLNTARELSSLLGVIVIGAVVVTRQAAAAERGAVPTEAYLAGYSAGLVFAAVLVLIGAVIGLVTLQRRAAKPESFAYPTVDAK